jgi:hypothetical protein
MKKELHKELEELSPWLAEMKEQPEGYTVPNHFFNNMRMDIMNKVKNEQIPIAAKPPEQSDWTSLVMILKSWMQPRLAVGFASLLLLLGAVYFFKNNEKLNVKSEEITQTVQPNNPTQNTDIAPEQNPKTEQNSATVVKENTPLSTQEGKSPTVEAKDETVASLTSEEIKPLSLEQASPEELDALLDELIQNGELNDEDIENIY